MEVEAAIHVDNILPLSLGIGKRFGMGVGLFTHLRGGSGAIFVLNLG